MQIVTLTVCRLNDGTYISLHDLTISIESVCIDPGGIHGSQCAAVHQSSLRPETLHQHHPGFCGDKLFHAAEPLFISCL